jgi:hypothetical protein
MKDSSHSIRLKRKLNYSSPTHSLLLEMYSRVHSRDDCETSFTQYAHVAWEGFVLWNFQHKSAFYVLKFLPNGRNQPLVNWLPGSLFPTANQTEREDIYSFYLFLKTIKM